jgi:hypothetical protein
MSGTIKTWKIIIEPAPHALKILYLAAGIRTAQRAEVVRIKKYAFAEIKWLKTQKHVIYVEPVPTILMLIGKVVGQNTTRGTYT